MKIDLVYNPASGSFRQARLDALVRAFERQGATVTVLPTERDGTRLSGTAELVCVHGGDGTLRDTVQALGSRAGEVPLCIAPAGTINLVARELGYARDPERLAAQVCAAWRRGSETWVSAPLYMLGEMPIVACLSIGADSRAVAQVSPELKKRLGRLAYVVAIVRQMRHWPRSTMAVSGELADGTRFELEAEAVIASHGALYAGPFQLSPRAALAADSVELIALRCSTRMAVFAVATAALLRLPIDWFGFVEIRTVRRVAFDRCVTPVQVDGDHMPDCAYVIGPSGMALNYVI